MIYIFHGDDNASSRQAFNRFTDEHPDYDCLRLDPKEIDLDKINNFLQGQSFFTKNKVLALTNYFSISKPIQDKLQKILLSTDTDILIWQDKNLTVAQLKSFSQAKVSSFKLDNKLYACLNTIRPHNLDSFLSLYHQVIKSGTYDLFLYLLKGSIRRQLSTYSKFDSQRLRQTYLQLIELDFQNKSGKLSIAKEIALERIMVNLLK